MEVGLGEVNLQVAMSKNLSVSKTPILPFFARKKGSFFEAAKVHNFSICQRTFFRQLFFGCKYINRSGLAQEKYSCCFPKVS